MKKKRPFSIRLFRFPILVQRKTKKSLRFALSLSLFPSTRARARGARHLAGGAGGREETRRRRDVKNDAFLARMSHWLYKKKNKEGKNKNAPRSTSPWSPRSARRTDPRATLPPPPPPRYRPSWCRLFFFFFNSRARSRRKAVFL